MSFWIGPLQFLSGKCWGRKSDLESKKEGNDNQGAVKGEKGHLWASIVLRWAFQFYLVNFWTDRWPPVCSSLGDTRISYFKQRLELYCNKVLLLSMFSSPSLALPKEQYLQDAQYQLGWMVLCDLDSSWSWCGSHLASPENGTGGRQSKTRKSPEREPNKPAWQLGL